MTFTIREDEKTKKIEVNIDMESEDMDVIRSKKEDSDFPFVTNITVKKYVPKFLDIFKKVVKSSNVEFKSDYID